MYNDGRHTILIVDDSRTNLAILSDILKTNYTVIAAKDGPSAIELAKNAIPDLILLDIIMPVMSGYEVLEKLKNIDTTRNIPVIIITGLDNSQDEVKGLRLGAVDYITKPFHSTNVELRVSTHLKIIDQMRTIERLGMIDALTDIPNRRSFDHQLSVEWNRAIRNKEPLSIMMLDIDRFKILNDTYGHAHGDVMLRAVAKIISQSMKRSADFVARWGGEEFAVLIPNTEFNGAMNLAEEIRGNVEKIAIPFSDGTETKVTISIGLNSEFPNDVMGVESFILKADKALYSAKESGRNRVKAFLL